MNGEHKGDCLDVWEATEFVTIITSGDEVLHVVGNWGEYMRVLGIGADKLVFPAGRYRQTETEPTKEQPRAAPRRM